jgi:hypothetical protein
LLFRVQFRQQLFAQLTISSRREPQDFGTNTRRIGDGIASFFRLLFLYIFLKLALRFLIDTLRGVPKLCETLPARVQHRHPRAQTQFAPRYAPAT